MEWNYKNIIISVESDGKFYFSIKENTHVANSLELAKFKIDEILKDYYTFNDREIKNLCKKLDKREAEFVRALIKELNIHRNSNYCEIGISSEMLFNILD